MSTKETLSALILSRLSYFTIPAMRQLLKAAGSFEAVVENRNNIRDIAPDCPQRIVKALGNIGTIAERAEQEAEFAASHGIQILALGNERYPQRLMECDDAPLVLFYKGTANLNQRRVINIVGTRHATVYADDCIRTLIEDLKQQCPELLIVSGLAYGVDIMAHRHSLDNGIPTVGVLAHGLDTIYPSAHRETAVRMVDNGGLLTEHFTHTNADKVNFVRRNRIVAGMSDATILVESAAKGGGLITCRMARDYNRDVFAFPGRVGDKCSEGCNNLIRDQRASLITGADDLVKAMMWEADQQLATAQKQGIERNLFPEVDGDQKKIVDALAANNDQQLNILAQKLQMPISRVSVSLFELEMKGMVKALAGSVYHLING